MKLWQIILIKLGLRAAAVASGELKNPAAKEIIKDVINTSDQVVDSLAAEEEAKK